MNNNLFGHIQTSQIWGQMYTDTSPFLLQLATSNACIKSPSSEVALTGGYLGTLVNTKKFALSKPKIYTKNCFLWLHISNTD